MQLQTVLASAEQKVQHEICYDFYGVNFHEKDLNNAIWVTVLRCFVKRGRNFAF